MKQVIILFDLDGTLIDSTKAIYASFCEAMSAFGYPTPSLDSLKATIGHTLEDMFLAFGIPKAQVGDFVQAYRISYRAKMEAGTTLLPNAKEAIMFAKSFADLGVVTTKRGDFSVKLLDCLGVGEYFRCVIGIESVSKPKPDSEPILKALEHFPNASSAHKYMIGDTTLDLESAKGAGISAVGVLCGYGKQEALGAYNVPLCVDSLMAVREIHRSLGI